MGTVFVPWYGPISEMLQAQVCLKLWVLVVCKTTYQDWTDLSYLSCSSQRCPSQKERDYGGSCNSLEACTVGSALPSFWRLHHILNNPSPYILRLTQRKDSEDLRPHKKRKYSQDTTPTGNFSVPSTTTDLERVSGSSSSHESPVTVVNLEDSSDDEITGASCISRITAVIYLDSSE